MKRQAKILPDERVAFAGEVHSLLEQLGCSDERFSFAKALPELKQVKTPERFRDFLQTYESDILIPIELPTIHQAYLHTSRNECRELVSLDQRLSVDLRLKNFARASQHFGRLHIEPLRSLKDNRLIQRYLQAIDSGHAHGWHTLVYGLTLAVYSMPLRQGLSAYAEQTLKGFIDSAERLRLSGSTLAALRETQSSRLHGHIEQLLSSAGVSLFRAA